MPRRDLPARHTQRWRGHDYGLSGAYFVTICTQDRICRFGSIRDGVLELNDLGRFARDTWAALPGRFQTVRAGTQVVMPSHFHGIVTLTPFTITAPAGPLPSVGPVRGDGPSIPRLQDIVGAFKSIVAVAWARSENDRLGSRPLGRLWQRNFWDRVLRDEEEVARAAAYVESNVANWAADPDRPSAGG